MSDHTIDAPARSRERGRLLAGGPDGNERLTIITGALLLTLLAALGVTILFIGRLLWLHIFLGCVLVGPIALKLGSVGYRLLGYYAGRPEYRRRGAPALVARMLAPLVVVCTLAVFATGATMLILGPSSRHSVLFLHKASFFAWLAVTSLHVLLHLPDVLRWLRRTLTVKLESLGARTVVARHRDGLPGHSARGAALGAAVLGGLALAIALSATISSFTQHVLAH